MKALHTEAGEAIDEGGTAEVRACQEAWHKRAMVWISQSAAAADAPAPKQKPRTKAHAWLLGTDKQLQAAVGVGWAGFAIPEVALRPAPALWPTISLCIDQGSDGWAAGNWLQRRAHVVAMLCCDPSHRISNDTHLALGRSQLWTAVLVLTVVLNLDQGPWKDQRWYEQCVQGVAEYVELTSAADCPLFESFRHDIMVETGTLDSRGDAGCPEALFKGLADAFRRKNPRIATSRWFAWVDGMHNFLTMWHQRLLVYMYVCLQLGVIKNSKMSEKIKAKLVGPAAGSGEQERERTDQDPEDLRKLRGACKNTMQFACLVLSDHSLYAVCRIITTVLYTSRKAHSVQNKALRSGPEVCKWYGDMALGLGMQELNEIVTNLRDEGALDLCGFSLGPPRPGDDDGTGDAALVLEDSWAAMMGGLSLNLLFQRIKSMTWHIQNVPGLLAGLCQRSSQAVSRIRQMHEASVAMCSQRSQWWKKVAGRSTFHLLVVEKFVLQLIASEWQLTDEIVQQAVACLLAVCRPRS